MALKLFETKATVTPPDGEGPLRVIVPVDDEPPITDDGATARLTRVGG